MKKIYTILTLATILVTLTSCEHKDLCWHHYATVRIEYDWVNAPDANPSSMRVYMYPVDNETSYRIIDLPKEGGYIQDVAPGDYRIITFSNNETSYERNAQSFVTAALTTSVTNLLEPLGLTSYSSTIPVAEGTEDEQPHFEPEIVWGCSVTEVTVDDNGKTYHKVFSEDDEEVINGTANTVDEQVITLYPEELTSIYTVEIRNVVNLSSISMMSATLSGLAGYLNLATGEPAGDNIIVPFETYTQGSSTIYAEFACFGTPATDDNKLILYAWLQDGTGYAFGVQDNADKFNVTDQVRSAEDPKHVHIIIDGLEIPKSESTGADSGFVTEVDDWSQVNIEIPV